MYILHREDQSLPNGSILHENLTEKKNPEMCILFNLASWKLYLNKQNILEWPFNQNPGLYALLLTQQTSWYENHKKNILGRIFYFKKKKIEEEEKNESLTLQKIPEMCTLPNRQLLGRAICWTERSLKMSYLMERPWNVYLRKPPSLWVLDAYMTSQRPWYHRNRT